MKFIRPFIFIIFLSAFSWPKVDSVGRVEKHSTDIIYHNINLNGRHIDKIILHNLRKTSRISYIDSVEIYALSSLITANNLVLKQTGNNIDELSCGKILLQQDGKQLANAQALQITDHIVDAKTEQLLNISNFAVHMASLYTGNAKLTSTLDTTKHSLVASDLNIAIDKLGLVTGQVSIGNVNGLSLVDLFTMNFNYAKLNYKNKEKNLTIKAAPPAPVSFFAIWLLKDHLPQLLKLLNVSIK